MENFLQEAFKRLSLLEDDFNLTDLDRGRIDELQAFVADDVEMPEDEEIIDVIDPEAKDEEDLEDIYTGKVILECECCHSRIYKNKEDVVIEDDLANINEACPVCGNEMGFTVIGKIEAYDDDREIEPEEEIEPEDGEIEKSEDELEDEEAFPDDDIDLDDDEKDESLKKHKFASDDSKKLDERFYDSTFDKDFDDAVDELERKSKENAEDIPDPWGGKEVEEALDEEQCEDKECCPECGKEPCECESLENASPEDQKYFKGQLDKIYNELLTLAQESEGVAPKLSKLLQQAMDMMEIHNDEINEGCEDGECCPKCHKEPCECEDVNEWYAGGADVYSKAQELLKKKGEPDESILDGEPGRSFAADVYNALAEVAFNYRADMGTDDPLEWFGPAFNNFIKKFSVEPPVEESCNKEEEFCPKCGKEVDEPCEDCKEEELKESVQELEAKVDGASKVEVFPGENGEFTMKVSETEAEDFDDIADATGEAAEEVGEIVPLDDAEQAEIEANTGEEVPEDEFGPEEDELDIEDFDEEDFDEMGESFITRTYDNVKSFKTTNAKDAGNKFIIEGIITYKNNKQRKTQFVFENAKITKRGKLVMEGYNEAFSKSNKAFTIKGTLTEGKLKLESLKYDYTVKQLNESNKQETVRVFGRIKSK